MELLNAHAKAAVACMWLQNDIEGKFVTAGHWESGLAEYFHSLRNIQKLVSKLISVLSFLLFVKSAATGLGNCSYNLKFCKCYFSRMH